jgi:hypothetical protein
VRSRLDRQIPTIWSRRSHQITGSEKKGHLLTCICTDFLASNDFTGDITHDRMKFWVKYENLFGKKFVVIDNATGEVEFGLSTLTKLAGGVEADSQEG